MIILASLNNLYFAGIPLRSFLVLAIATLVMLEGSAYFTDLKLLNICYGLMATIGLVISVYNGGLGSEIFNGLMRLLQSYLFIVVAYYLVVNFGPKGVAYPFLLVAIPSALVGLLQYAGLDAAWQIRDLLGSFQNSSTVDQLNQLFIEERSRAPGITLFAITQSYLLIASIALTLLLLVRAVSQNKSTFWLFIALLILFLGCIASETRSVLGAAVVMIFLTFLKVNRSATAVVAILTILAGSIVFTYTQLEKQNDNDGSRLVSLEDQSAKGRFTLYKYGLELALKKSQGYGFGFKSTELATDYFINERNIYEYGHQEKAQFLVEIHNSLLNIIHTYGFLGLLVFLFYVIKLATIRWFFIVVIGSYMIHALFHNAGIMMHDLFIDGVIAVILFYKYQVASISNTQTGTHEHTQGTYFFKYTPLKTIRYE